MNPAMIEMVYCSDNENEDLNGYEYEKSSPVNHLDGLAENEETNGFQPNDET